MEILDQIKEGKVPEHIAIIMDGNGRWAKSRGKARIFGHRNAITAVRDTVEGAAEAGVKCLTLYAFSTENWKRPEREVNALMELLVNSIHNEIKTLNKNNIRLKAIGDLQRLPKNCLRELNKGIDKTRGNNTMDLVLALNYSSKWELANAAKKIAVKVQNNAIDPDAIDEDLIKQHLTTTEFPDPELMIRTSGELRISNFLLWQLAYAELYFLEKFWPDFRKKDLFEAILSFQKRERRFGLTSEQLTG